VSQVARTWAATVKTGKASYKAVLKAYADRHNEETGFAFPSIAWLCEDTELDRKTVINAVAHLEAAGLMIDTGHRTGTTKQVKVYGLAIVTVPKTERFQKRNSTENDDKQSQKRDTEPLGTIPKIAKATLGTRAKKPDKHSLSDEWKPAAFGADTQSAKIMDDWPPGKLAHQLEHFRAHHTKKNDKFSDWQSAWSTWVLNSPKFRGNDNGNQKPNPNGIGRTTAAALTVIDKIHARQSANRDAQPRLGYAG
jgi:hypothetical protein